MHEPFIPSEEFQELNEWANPQSRILSREQCEEVNRTIQRIPTEGGETSAFIVSWWNGELRWARNRVNMATDRRDTLVYLKRRIRGAEGTAVTNQLDSASIEAAIREAERIARIGRTRPEPFHVPKPAPEYLNTITWSASTFDSSAAERQRLLTGMIEPAERAGMLTAGYIEVRAQSGALIGHEITQSELLYAQLTQAQCSLTVRTPDGTGSGWAGRSSFAWSKIDAKQLAETALNKCILSQNPVRIEPGRYTVILEPQAVHDLATVIIDALDRKPPERDGFGPFALDFDQALGLWRSKLGLRIIDERITIDHDPLVEDLTTLPFDTNLLNASFGEAFRRVTWIDRGVLTTLSHGRRYALMSRNENIGAPNSKAFRMSGGSTSIEAMIEGTRRGLLVTRLSNLMVLDPLSLQSTATTRDGLWLIENGKITRAVRNMRITESPLFVFNQIEAIGPAVPVFNPVKLPHIPKLTPAIVPSIKARDFSFTATSDAI
jgi:predicted Zn-dependent protease